MPMTPEAKVKKAVKAWLIERGVWFFMPVPTGRGVIGIPDFICCWNGVFIAIETKSESGRLTPAQKGNIEDIRRAGGIALVIRSAAELEEHFHAHQT
jgi:VRR-NUC domain